MGRTLRSQKTEQAYKEHLLTHNPHNPCRLCAMLATDALSVKKFNLWKIVQNEFPYDYIAKEHHLLLPCRHVTEHELTAEEHKELLSIKDEHLRHHYDFMQEATHRTKSIPGHFHLHLILVKDEF